ncbi:MAG: transglutaminase domain-containing protein [Oscillospiraceae bacterium]|nr:transglutaminase domain-containing protein [Oscillospiraceae bacterium]
MHTHSFFSKENLMRKALPYLFTTALMAAIANLYLKTYFNIYTLIAIILTALVYAMCDFMTRHKLLAVPVYLLAGFGTGFAIISLFIASPSRMLFFEWFMTGGETVDTIPQYMLILIIGFGFFISSVTYYFSHVIYRVAIFTLLSLIPCAIYVKAAQTVPLALAAVIAALNIFLFIADVRRKASAEYSFKGSFGTTAYVDFAAAAVLIAVLLPKPSVAPYYEKFEEFSNRFAFWGKASGISGEYMEHSGNADAYQEIENKLIYNVYTDTPQYFKIQVFDVYDSENRWWISSEQPGNGVKDWQDAALHQNFSNLLTAYTESGSEILSKQKTAVYTEEDVLKTARVQSVDYPSQFIIAPLRTIGTELLNRPNEAVLRSRAYEFFPSATSLRANDIFTLGYYDQNFTADSGWLTSGMCDLTYDEFTAALTSSLSWYVYDSGREYESDSGFKSLRAFAEEASRAEKFSAENYAPVSDEIQQLSDQLTAGLVYDYQKADALARYLRSGSFTYDLAYRAPEESDTPEYFLFNSRRGTCSDFSTSFCLLARGAGLTVRYVEGFTADPSELYPGVYEIYTEDAHAYPEVYIPGAGWVIYDPTPAASESAGSGGSGETEEETDYLAVFITCLGIFISVAAVVVLIAFLPLLERKFFSLKLKRIPPEKGIVLVYGRLSASVERLCGIETAVMTSSQLGRFILDYTGVSADDIILPFERSFYGELPCTYEETFAADLLLTELTSTVKSINKEKRKAK